MSPQEPFGRLGEEPRAGPIDEFELVLFVEREHGDVDFRHDLAQQGGRFEGIEPLMPERFDEGVHLDHHLAERIAAARASGTDGEVPFAERGKQVRQGLQGKDDSLAEREGEAETKRDDEYGQGPLHLRGVVAGPQENQGDGCPGKCRGERHQKNTTVMTQARLAPLRQRHE